MSIRLDCSTNGHAATIEARLSAEVSADGTGRRRGSGTVESIRHRDSGVWCTVEVGGEPFVERTLGVDEPFDEGPTEEPLRDQGEVLAFDSSDNTVACRW